MVEDDLDKLKKLVKNVKKAVGELAEERIDFSSSSNISADFDDIIDMEEAIEDKERMIKGLDKLKKQGTKIIFGNDEDNFKGIVDVKSYEGNEIIIILNLFVTDILDLDDEVLSLKSDNSIRTFFKYYDFSKLIIEEIGEAIKDLYLKLKKMRIHKMHSVYEELNHCLSKLLETEVEIDNIIIHENYDISEKGLYLSLKRESKKIDLPQMQGIKETIITHYDKEGNITDMKRILEGKGTMLFSAISTKKDGIFDKIECNSYQGKPFLKLNM